MVGTVGIHGTINKVETVDTVGTVGTIDTVFLFKSSPAPPPLQLSNCLQEICKGFELTVRNGDRRWLASLLILF